MRSKPPLPLLLLLLLTTTQVHPFSPHTSLPLQRHDRRHRHPHSPSSTPPLSMTDDTTTTTTTSTTPTPPSPKNDPLAEAQKLRDRAVRLRLEAERERAALNLVKIAKLEAALESSSSSSSLPSGETTEKGTTTRNEVMLGIEQLVREVDPSLLPTFQSASAALTPSVTEDTTPTPPPRDTSNNTATTTAITPTLPLLSPNELTTATSYYQSLPITIRRTLAEAIDLSYEDVSPEVIVLGLYEKSDSLEPSTLSKIYQRRLRGNEPEKESEGRVVTITINADGTVDSDGEPTDDEMKQQIASIIEEFQTEMAGENVTNVVESLVPRLVRPNDGRIPTEEDVVVLTERVLTKDNWRRSGPAEPIPGGFLIRGSVAPDITRPPRGSPEAEKEESQKTTVSERLLSAIDTSLDSIDPTWNEKFQVSYVYDVTLTDLEDGNIDEPVLLVTTRNFRPVEPRSVLRTSVTALSFFLTVVFCITTYGDNTAVVQRLTEVSEAAQAVVGATPDIGWFNDLLQPLFVGLALPQLGSEVAHQVIARRDGFKTSSPTVLPSLTLPYLSFQTSLKTSPPNPSSLFDYGLVGPATGMLLSSAIFAYGLRLTVDADPSMMATAPSVPVSFLQYSTLFGTIIDYILSGGDGGVFSGQGGIILNQPPSTSIPLHPYAIVGMASFLIHSLDVIPVGGTTDGGRMSQGLLGRKEHLGLSAAVSLVLFVEVLFGERSEILAGYLVTMWFLQKDGCEVVCRDEVEKGGLGRAMAALVVWSLAVLALTPIG